MVDYDCLTLTIKTCQRTKMMKCEQLEDLRREFISDVVKLLMVKKDDSEHRELVKKANASYLNLKKEAA